LISFLLGIIRRIKINDPINELFSFSRSRTEKEVEGNVLYNPGTGTVDPRQDQGAIPLRFNTDPATVFLPSVQQGP
jgi:hypothetical protein